MLHGDQRNLFIKNCQLKAILQSLVKTNNLNRVKEVKNILLLYNGKNFHVFNQNSVLFQLNLVNFSKIIKSDN